MGFEMLYKILENLATSSRDVTMRDSKKNKKNSLWLFKKIVFLLTAPFLLLMCF